MTFKKAALFTILLSFASSAVQARTEPSLNEERFNIMIKFQNSHKKYNMICTLSDPCKVKGHMKIQGYPQPVRIVLDLSSKHHNKSDPTYYTPTGYRYNFTIDTGDDGDFLNTAHLSKRGELPPYEGTSFKAPLTYWYKKNGKKKGRELKKIIDYVHVKITKK